MKRAIFSAGLLLSSLAAAQTPATPVPGKQQPAPVTSPTATQPPTGTKAPAPGNDPWAGRTDLFVLPPMKATTKVQLGALSRSTTGNGIELIVVPRRTIPSVEVTLALRLPETAEPLDKSGLASFTAQMLRKGTKKRTADQISEAIDFVGGSLGADALGEGIIVSCHARARDLSLCLDLVSDVAMNAQFPEKEMAEIAQQLEASINQSKDNPGALAQRHEANVFYGDDDVRGRPLSKRSLDAIDRKSLVDFHARWFAPNDSIIAVSGDVDEKSVKALIGKYFGAWKKHEVPALVEKAPRPMPEAAKLPVRLVDMPEASQTNLVLVGPGIKHADPDLYAVRLMNYTLGGGVFSSRLMKVVRSEGGKTYSVRSNFEVGRDPGPFEVSTFTRNAETANTVKLILAELGKMRDNGPTQEELTAAKNNLIGGYGLHLETGEDLASNLIGAELDGLDKEFVAQYPARLDAVTLDDVKRVAKNRLDVRALVAVGKAAEAGPLLKKAGYGRIEVVNFLDPVSTTERKEELSKRSAAAQVLPQEATEGKRLLELALAAKGGQAALTAVKTIDMSGEGELSAMGQKLAVIVEERQIRGQAARLDIDMGQQQLTQSYFEGKGTMRSGDRVMNMPPNGVEEMRKGMFRDVNFILINALDKNAKVRGLKPETVNNVGYDVLEVISPEGDTTRLWLDQKTHLIEQLRYTADNKTVTDVYTSYKAVNGIKMPFRSLHDTGTERVDITYKKIELNPKLGLDLFK
jgi:zinc protease